MPTQFPCAIHLRGRVETGEAARRLAACLPVLEAHGLEPLAPFEPGWRDGTPAVFGATQLMHRDFVEQSGDPFWGAGFMVVPAPEADATVVTMSTPGDPRAEAWRWLTPCAEELLDATGSDLGMINGFSIRSDGSAVGGTPAGAEVAPGRAPRVLLPWMYFGAGRLSGDGLRPGLEALQGVAHRSSPSPGGGWILQAHEEFSTAEPQSLLAAYGEQFGAPPPEWIADE
jgi:hypothetical protein